MPIAIRILIYLLLGLQVISALTALNTGDFLFKSGSAGIGALIILILASRRRFATPDLWMVIGAFLFSIVGDYFLSHRNGELMMFVYGILFFFVAHVGYLAYSLFNGKYTGCLPLCYVPATSFFSSPLCMKILKTPYCYGLPWPIFLCPVFPLGQPGGFPKRDGSSGGMSLGSD